ncbi:hypothetical protein E3P98_02483 [Wallemia ichthyophaga]|nr:hypothetical protein E3P98_02483 [Wallemia ichthyophaga]
MLRTRNIIFIFQLYQSCSSIATSDKTIMMRNPTLLNPHTVSGLRQSARVEADAPDGTPLYDLDQLVNYTVKDRQLKGISFDPPDPTLEFNNEQVNDRPVEMLELQYTDSNLETFHSLTSQVLQQHDQIKDKVREYMIFRNQARSQKIEGLNDDYAALQVDWEASCERGVKVKAEQQHIMKKRSRRGEAVEHVELTNRRNANMSRKPVSAVPQHVVAEATPPVESTDMEATDSSSIIEKATQDAEPMHFVNENDMEEMENEKFLNQMLQRLQTVNKRDPKIRAVRTQANIPNQEVTSIDRWACSYNDANARIFDPTRYYERSYESLAWSEEEKEVFLKAYVDTPKSFAEIAEKIPGKTVQDCVLFYYMNKKVRRDNKVGNASTNE